MSTSINLEAKKLVYVPEHFEYTNKCLDEPDVFEVADGIVTSLPFGGEIESLKRLNSQEQSTVKMALPEHRFAGLEASECARVDRPKAHLNAGGKQQ